MGDLMACVEASDVVFAASGSEELLVHAEDLAAMPRASEQVGGWEAQCVCGCVGGGARWFN